jgi:DNA-directed RNA polymerase I, II, and III subunit RPABC1
MIDPLNFYKVYNNVRSLLYKRGYELVPEIDYGSFKNLTKEELVIKTKSRPDYKIQKDKINVYFPDEIKVGIKTIRTYKNELVQEDIQRSIIVVKDGITPFAKSEIVSNEKDIHNTNAIIEIFSESELFFDITEHELVPKHEEMTKDEEKALLKEYNIKESQLPKILINDPVSKFYGFQKGSIIKIYRHSETAGHYTNYRVVI